MSKVMVRYTVKPEKAEENERLIRAVYEELELTAPADLRYATFKLDDGVSFLHVASNETEDGRSPLRSVKAFREFQKDVAGRCAEKPLATELHEIGSFRFWQ
jgi:hypothetical protein